MVYLEFFDNQKLAIVEKDEIFLDRTCADGRKEIISEIGELLPTRFRFRVWGNPLSTKQESIYTLRKCAVEIQENLENDYPAGTRIFRVEIRAVANEDAEFGDSNLKLQGTSASNLTCSSTSTSATPSTSNIGEKAVERLIQNLNEQRQSLEYRLQLAQATVSSLKEKPRERATIGQNRSFTCSNCHYKGHRVTGCHQPPCQGYFECGNLSLHKEHREELRKAEAELKEVTRLLKANKDELENTKFLKERTKTNFFASMRSRLQGCNAVKYSNRVHLDNDLRVLAAACNHKVPADGVNLEELIGSYKSKARAEYRLPDLNCNEWQSPRPGPFQEKYSVSPPVNNYFTSCYDVNYNNSSQSNVNYRGRPYDARGWQRRGTFLSPPTRDWSNPNFWDSSPVCSRSPSVLPDKQPRKRLNYSTNFPKQNKKSKQALGEEYRRNLINLLPKQKHPSSSTVTTNQISCSTPKRDSVVVTDENSPEALSESPVLSVKDSQPFDYDAWEKAQIAQIKDLDNTNPSQTP